MAATIDYHLLYSILRVVATGDELSMFTKKRMLANLCFQIVNSASNLLKNGSFECHVLDYVHFPTNLFVFSFIANETSTGTRKETLWILAKKKDASCTYLLLTICLCHKIIILAQILHARFPITNDTHVIIDKIHVYIIDGRTIDVLIFVITFSFVIEKLHALVKVELLTFVANTHETFVRLIGVKLTTCRNMHQKNAILVANIIRTWQILAPNLDRLIAEIESKTKQLIQPFFISINALDSSCLVRNTNSKHATISISHSHNGYC